MFLKHRRKATSRLPPRAKRPPLQWRVFADLAEHFRENKGLDTADLMLKRGDEEVARKVVDGVFENNAVNLPLLKNVEDILGTIRLYMISCRQPIVPTHIHKTLLFEFVASTDDETRTIVLKKNFKLIEKQLVDSMWVLCELFHDIAQHHSTTNTTLPNLADQWAVAFFPNPPKPNPKLVANRPFLTLHLISNFRTILSPSSGLRKHATAQMPPAPVAPVNYAPLSPSNTMAASSSAAFALSPRSFGGQLTSGTDLLTAAEYHPGASSATHTQQTASTVLSSSSPPPTRQKSVDNFDDELERDSTSTGSTSTTTTTPRNTPFIMNESEPSVPTYLNKGALKPASFSLTVAHTTSPSQDKALRSEQTLLNEAKVNPTGFWDMASRAHVPSSTVVNVLCSQTLTKAERNALIPPLLNELIAAECLASNGTATKRGCTHLYKSLWRMIQHRIQLEFDALASDAAQKLYVFLQELDFFLEVCSHPGETCFVLESFAMAYERFHKEDDKFDMRPDLDPLLKVLKQHLNKLGQFKQQERLAFLPWMDVQKLLTTILGKEQTANAMGIVSNLKKAHRMGKRQGGASSRGGRRTRGGTRSRGRKKIPHSRMGMAQTTL